MQDDESTANLTPLEVVERLDRFIVGQVRSAFVTAGSCQQVDVCTASRDSKLSCMLLPDQHSSFQACMLSVRCTCLQADAKRAVANALRNRWRRHRIESPMKVTQNA